MREVRRCNILILLHHLIMKEKKSFKKRLEAFIKRRLEKMCEFQSTALQDLIFRQISKLKTKITEFYKKQLYILLLFRSSRRA